MTVTKKITASLNEVGVVTFDGLGRISETELASDPLGADFTVITYDADGRKATENKSVSHHVRLTYDRTNTSMTGSIGLRSHKAGRLIGPNELHRQCHHRDRRGGKNPKEFADGKIGKMTEVIEGVGTPNFVTNYTYDALDDLTSAVQGGSHRRTFVYDSLKRLTSSLNPETGTTPVLYTYDATAMF